MLRRCAMVLGVLCLTFLMRADLSGCPIRRNRFGQTDRRYVHEADCINATGQIVGVSWRDGSYGNAFLYSNGTMTNIGTVAGYPYTHATGINTGGQIVGYSENSSAAEAHNSLTIMGQ